MKRIMCFIKKTFITATVMTLASSVMLPAVVQAATYRDVPASLYAYTAVDWVSNPVNGSIMVGDASNNFNPARTLDKFETAKIMAVAAGYKYSATAITPDEQQIFDTSYTTNKPLLDSLAVQYAKWSKTSDREIAYLMYKGILTAPEVAQFITKINGIETINYLTKQEAILLILRLIGKQSSAEAIAIPYHSPFKDDAQIRADYKKYVYYAKETGIAVGFDNYINPTKVLTRAEMAQLFYTVLSARPPQTVTTDNTNVNTPNNTPSNTTGTTGNITTITGVIDSVYLDTHLYVTTNNTPKIFKLAGNVVIMIDNKERSASHLSGGMSFTALVNAGNEIVSISALTPAKEEEDEPKEPVKPIYLNEDEGYVTSITAGNNPRITISSQRVKLTGELVTEKKDYTLADDYTITEDGSDIDISDIEKDDIILFRHDGSQIYEIELQERERTIVGTLIEKKYVELSSTPVLIIEDEDDNVYELRVTSSTRFTRDKDRNAVWSDLRVGDDIEADCEYDKLTYVTAEGKESTVDGIVEEIRVTENNQQIVVTNNKGEKATYTISDSILDVYELRVGMELRLYLDSWEIYDLDIRDYPSSSTKVLVGEIISLHSGNTMVVEESGTDKTYTITVDKDTIDTKTKKAINFDDLKTKMNVYIVLVSINSRIADSITILP